MATIALIGLGSVGASTALSLIHRRIQGTLLLVDIKSSLRDAQVRDLADAALVYGSVTKIEAATHQEASQADVVIITAGVNYTPGILLPLDIMNLMTKFEEDGRSKNSG